jgi:hypothetical protein
VSSVNGASRDDSRRGLVERIAASPVLGKSARLHDLLVYLCNRVLEGEVTQIHEQEVGHHVFGRPPDYDTTADNIVRVHASLLRKRLADYFSKDGAEEPTIIEIPKGNYAPVFRERSSIAGAPVAAGRQGTSWLSLFPGPVLALACLALFFAASTVFLLVREFQVEARANQRVAERPTVHLLWSQVFRPNRPTDVILDDATVGLYQELVKRPIALNDYYDRSYLRKIPEAAEAANLDPDAASSVMLRRHSSYAAVILLWKLFQISESEQGQTAVQFARDYSFHGLKTNNAVLLGYSQSNRWVEPFESRLGLRWAYDKSFESSYPIDSWASESDRASFRPSAEPGDIREGYCAISLLPNLGANGNVLLISATGGATITACGDFLSDEQAVSGLHRRLAGASEKRFPYFEALLRVKGRSTLPRDINIVLCRAPKS